MSASNEPKWAVNGGFSALDTLIVERLFLLLPYSNANRNSVKYFYLDRVCI